MLMTLTKGFDMVDVHLGTIKLIGGLEHIRIRCIDCKEPIWARCCAGASLLCEDCHPATKINQTLCPSDPAVPGQIKYHGNVT